MPSAEFCSLASTELMSSVCPPNTFVSFLENKNINSNMHSYTLLKHKANSHSVNYEMSDVLLG